MLSLLRVKTLNIVCVNASKRKYHSDLRRQRMALELTLREVADAIGCTDVAVHYAERGMRPSGRIVREMATYLLRLEAERGE